MIQRGRLSERQRRQFERPFVRSALAHDTLSFQTERKTTEDLFYKDTNQGTSWIITRQADKL
jgi:hypothetical protein